MHRKTRFVCVSDTHAYMPSEAGFKLPAGDVLIHAGDLTNKGSLAELRRTMDWIVKADFEIKIIVAGNHDVTLDSEFYANHGHEFHDSQLEDPRQCLEIVTHAPSVLYQDATALWDDIPSDSDIVVTHTPPQSHCDQKPTGKRVGCNALRQALRRIRPSLALCGHVHEGRGYERVRWHSTGLDADDVIPGVLPGSKKQALIDLTGRRGGTKLDNEGFSASLDPSPRLTQESISSTRLDGSDELCSKAPALSACSHEPGDGHDRVDTHPVQTLRRETCIVNAAILATSWPHRGGKRFNAPIVVDLELPVRRDSHASPSPVK